MGHLAGKSGEPSSLQSPSQGSARAGAIPGCQICRPGCSGVPAPSEQARARSPSLPGHRAPSRLSSAPVAWQPCVWEGGQPWSERWVAVLPQSASPHQPSSPLLLFRGAFWQLHSFLQAKKSRFAAICSKTPHTLHQGPGQTQQFPCSCKPPLCDDVPSPGPGLGQGPSPAPKDTRVQRCRPPSQLESPLLLHRTSAAGETSPCSC